MIRADPRMLGMKNMAPIKARELGHFLRQRIPAEMVRISMTPDTQPEIQMFLPVQHCFDLSRDLRSDGRT